MIHPLAVSDGAAASSRRTLKVIGADAKVTIGGDLEGNLIFELQMSNSFKPNTWVRLSGAIHTVGRNVLVVPVDLLTSVMFFRLASQ